MTPSTSERGAAPTLAILAVAVAVVALLFVWRSWEPERSPEPVAFAPLPVEGFADPGALTEAWADVDGDGDPDRFVGFNGAPARLYLNEGAGAFRDAAPSLGLDVERAIRTAAWGDFDADADPDLFLGFAGDAPVTALYRNDGGSFTEVAADVGVRLESGATRQASWVDVDGDGRLDLFLALRDGPNRLWRNTAAGFEDVSDASGIGDPRRSVGAVWFDADADGDLDLYVANMDGDANGLWVNEGGRFTDRAPAWGLDRGGRRLGDAAEGSVRPCLADVDGNGRLDLSLANYGANGVFLSPDQGGAWTATGPELAGEEGGRYDSCLWADFDHDGSLDLFVNGTVTGGVQYRDFLYRREGGADFIDVTPAEVSAVAADHGATWVDVDLDGDVDLSLTGATDEGSHPVLQNLLRPEFAGHSLLVRPLDARGVSIPGALVRAYAPGTDRVVATGLVDTGSGYDAQNDLPVHLGLPGGQPVDVEVVAPGRSGPRIVRMEGVDPAAWRGRALEVRIGG